MREILFRGKRVDNGEWIEGYLTKWESWSAMTNTWTKHSSLISTEWCNIQPYYGTEVLPETVGQLRYKNEYGSYFDGDIYYHAGNGNCIVSDLGELQFALMMGNTDDIGKIIGNIHDNPELLTKI